MTKDAGDTPETPQPKPDPPTTAGSVGMERPLYKDVGFLAILAVGLVSAVTVYLRQGVGRFLEIVERDILLLATILPKVAAGVLVAAFLRLLLPREVVARWIGERSGLKGLAVATLAGAVIPGGPMTIFPIAGALFASGADRGATVAFITSWLTIGLNRAIVWELSFYGPEFVIIRWLASLPLPFLAGLAARALPLSKAPPGDGEKQP